MFASLARVYGAFTKSSRAALIASSTTMHSLNMFGFHVYASNMNDERTMDELLGYNTPKVFHKYFVDLTRRKQAVLQSKSRFQQFHERENRSDVSTSMSRNLTMGKNQLQFQGIVCMKGGLDLVTYAQMFEHVSPATIFEMGALYGGTSLWMAKYLRMLDIDCQVISMDLDLSLLDSRVKELQPDNLTFIEGDSFKIEETMTADFLHNKPHPWVIIEDAHANFVGVLEHFHKFMKEGDYIICDDTDPETPVLNGMGMGWDGYPEWESSGPAKMNDLEMFMNKYDKFYAVDTFLTDLFGYNATNNWNGYIKRIM